MTQVVFDVTVNANDAVEISSVTDNTTTNINLNTSSSYGGMQFTVPGSGGIPRYARITSAYLTLNFVSGSFDDPNCVIHGLTSGGTNFTNGGTDISGRSVTTASVSWVATGIGTGLKNSPDIASVIQELVDQSGWTSTTPPWIRMKSNATATCRFSCIEGAVAPRLTVDYEYGSILRPRPRQYIRF